MNLDNQSIQKEVYELRTYDLIHPRKQEALLSFFQEALIPAYNRQYIKAIGVFEELGMTFPPKIYLLIPHTSFEAYAASFTELENDKQFLKDSEKYNSIQEEDKLFVRYETDLLLAFDGLKKMHYPQTEDRLFEFRTYQGYSEDAVRRKIMMFDKDELDLFYERNMNPLFFGKAIAGKNLPKLSYMIYFENMEQRDATWKNFFTDNPGWDRIVNAPEYLNTVSRVERVFLKPLEISQI